MQQDYYSVLARAIVATAQDDTQLRRMVYELARTKLRRQLLLQFKNVSRPQMNHHLRELETAIEQLESDAAQNVPLLTFSGEGQGSENLDVRADPSRHADLVRRQPGSLAAALTGYDLAPATWPLQRLESAPLPPLSEFVGHFGSASPPHRTARTWFKLQVAAAVVLGIAIYAAIERQTLFSSLTSAFALHEAPLPPAEPARQTASHDANSQPIRSPLPNVPLPSNYGVYAIDDGKLSQLEPLPIRVPDPRVSISGVITSSSPTSLRDGRLQFVVFRRDLVNNAPERVVVRVIAQVMRALTFSNGKAIVHNVEASWAVRGNSYEMRVAPMSGNPEMVMVRPATENFSFPAGRYALVLKTLAYDFTVEGPITDPAHCLERTDTVDSPIYSECRGP
jgi:hypothetical protein